jgi:hypothetical protein
MHTFYHSKNAIIAHENFTVSHFRTPQYKTQKAQILAPKHVISLLKNKVSPKAFGAKTIYWLYFVSEEVVKNKMVQFID